MLLNLEATKIIILILEVVKTFSKNNSKILTMKNKIAERLRSLLLEEGISAYKLAKDLNISGSVVKYWLDGKTTPNADYIIELADYFNVCADYLLGRKDFY